jgi:hypothetical protein
MLSKEVIAVSYENHIKPITKPTLCGENAELLIVTEGGTYSYHEASQH